MINAFDRKENISRDKIKLSPVLSPYYEDDATTERSCPFCFATGFYSVIVIVLEL